MRCRLVGNVAKGDVYCVVVVGRSQGVRSSQAGSRAADEWEMASEAYAYSVLVRTFPFDALFEHYCLIHLCTHFLQTNRVMHAFILLVDNSLHLVALSTSLVDSFCPRHRSKSHTA